MLLKQDIKKFKKKLTSLGQFRLQSPLASCLADPTCLKILYVLTNSKYACPSNFSEILNLSLPAISHQLAKLKHMGIITTVRHGQMICYSLSDSKEAKLVKNLVSTIARYETV